MKIVKKADSTWSYDHTCVGCDSELQLEKSDVNYKYHSGDQRDCTSSYETYTAICPVCRNGFDIPQEKMSKIVKLEIQQQ